MPRPRAALLLVTVAMVLLAGCSTGDTGTPTVTVDDTTASPTDTMSPTTTSTSTPNAATIAERAVEAIDGVRTYRVAATESRTVVANLAQRVQIRRNVSVNRVDRRLHAAVTQTVLGQTTRADVYIVNETVYQRSQAYVRQFSTEWIRIPVSENFTTVWRTQDAIERHKLILRRTDLAVRGTATIDGVETYRLVTTTDPERLEDVFAELVVSAGSTLNESTYSLTNGSYTFWLSTETYRPVKVAGTINSTISASGRSIAINQSFVFRYEYPDTVSIELPRAAEGAPTLPALLNASSSRE